MRQTGPDSAELPDLLMRLADLHLDKKAYFELQAGTLFEKIHEAEHGSATPAVAAPVVTPAKPAAAHRSRLRRIGRRVAALGSIVRRVRDAEIRSYSIPRVSIYLRLEVGED